MADSKLIETSGIRITTSTGAPAAGAKIYVYDAGTTDLHSIYTDSALTVASANPVTCDSAGLAPFIYVGTTSYKLRIETSGGTLIDEEDNLPGATNTATLSATYARPQTPVQVKTTNYTTISTDVGTQINVNCTGGDVTITVLNATTAADGGQIIIRHIGTANQVNIVSTDSETFTLPSTGVTTTSFALTGYGESVTLVSDAAGWHVQQRTDPLISATTGVIQVIDRISAAPGTPVDGGRYLVTAAYSTFEQHDIIEYTGQTGTYIEYTPPTDCGWLAYVQDENQLYQFQDSAWVTLAATKTDMEAATSSAVFSAPATQHNHPGHPKAWIYITISGGTPTNTADYGVASITDSGVGQIGVTFDTTMSSTSYIAVGSFLGSPSGFKASSVFASNIGTGGFTYAPVTATATNDTTLTSVDTSGGMVVFGDQ